MSEVKIFRYDPDFSFLQIRPGDRVVLKPNLVKQHKESDTSEWESVITSPRLVEMVCRHVCGQLKGSGSVTICDAPQTDSSFRELIEVTGLDRIAAVCRKEFGVPVNVMDLRDEEWVSEEGIVVGRRRMAGDPAGKNAFNLGTESLFFGHASEGRYYGADYFEDVVNAHHRGVVQEYLLCATPLLADVFINMPKMKTHKKTGVTLNLKNLVGINADKNWLPHHSVGAPSDGGDEYPNPSIARRFERMAVRLARSIALHVPGVGAQIAQSLRKVGTPVFGDGAQKIRSGNWYGNDTCWRMVLDLNRCLLYGNADGSLRRRDPKRYYSVVDGIIGMDGSGPMRGDRVESNVVITGDNPAAVDMVAARVMGFDWRKIPMIREAFNLTSFPISACRPEDVMVKSDIDEWNGRFLDIESREFLQFRPHFGWAGHIEYSRIDG